MAFFLISVIVVFLSWITTIFSGDFVPGTNNSYLSIPRILPEDVIAVSGTTVQLNCTLSTRAPYHGVLRYSWFKDQENISATGSVLTLVGLSQSLHAGQYVCMIEDSIGRVFSPPVSVAVAALPLANITSGLSFRVADNVRLMCSTPGAIPTPNITWLKNNAPLQASASVRLLSGGVLHLYAVTQDTGGVYRCSASNMAATGVMSDPVKLTVLDLAVRELQVLQGPVGTDGVVTGDEVMWECLANRPSTVTWYRDGNVLQPGGGIIFDGVVLKIATVDKRHSGLYWCQVASRESAVNSTKALLKVLEVPELILDHNPMEGKGRVPGMTAHLKCEFVSYPSSIVRWYHNGRPLTDDNAHVKMQDYNTVLVITQISVEDSGYYQCLGTNSAGTTYGQHIVHVFVSLSDAPAPPTALSAVALGPTSIVLRWTPGSSDSNIIAYSIDYRPVYISQSLQVVGHGDTPGYVVTDLLQDTEYVFFVVAYNSKTASDKSEEVTARTLPHQPCDSNLVGVPPTPAGLKAEPVNGTAVRLTWYKDACWKALTYTLRYHRFLPPELDEGQEYERVSTDDCTVTVGGLVPGTSYIFAVSSRHRIASPYSEPVQVQLPNGATVPSVTVSVVVQSCGPNWIRLELTSAVPGLTYHIRYHTKPLDLDEKEWHHLLTQDSYIRIGNLTSDTLYYIHVSVILEGQELYRSGPVIKAQTSKPKPMMAWPLTTQQSIVAVVATVVLAISIIIALVLLKKRKLICRRLSQEQYRNGTLCGRGPPSTAHQCDTKGRGEEKHTLLTGNQANGHGYSTEPTVGQVTINLPT